MSNLKYFLADADKHKARVYQMDFIGAFLQANVKHRVFVELDSRYGEYFPDYINYFGILFRINKSMYGINNSGNIFDDELTNCLIYEAGLNQSRCQIYVYYKYEPDGSKLVVLYYVYDFLYWYTYDQLGKCFVDTHGKRFHVKFLGY